MSDERSPARNPSSPSTDDAIPTPEPPAGDGFLIDDQERSPLDGEQLFRRAVAPTPPHSPHFAPMRPLPDPLPDEDDPAPVDHAQLARIGGFIAIGIGILALISTRELPLPLFLIVTGALLSFYVGAPARLRREQVVDRWDCLISGGQGRDDAVLETTKRLISSQRLPAVQHERRELAASRLRGGTRPFLVISQQGNGRLRPYRMHVNVRDYGQNLQASWFLTYHRGFFERLKPNPLVSLNLFDEQDLRAYVTAVHHGFLDAVIELMVSLGQDSTKLDRKTNGFLGIS